MGLTSAGLTLPSRILELKESREGNVAMLSVNWTYLLPILVCTSSALPSLSLHPPEMPLLPFGCPGSFFHSIFFGDSPSPGGFPAQTTQAQSILTARPVDQHHGQPHQLHPVRGKTSPPSPSAQQPPGSPAVASHSLWPAVAFTAAAAQHCKAGPAPALGSDYGLCRCARQHQRPCSHRTLLGWPCKVIHSSATARAAWWESSGVGIHHRELTWLGTASVSHPWPVPSCQQMMWLCSSTVQSLLQQEAAQDLLSSRQSLAHKENPAAPSSC